MVDICEMCDSELVKIDTKIISDTKYNILKCEKCNRQVARREE